MKKIFSVLAIAGLMLAATACGCTDNVKEPAQEEAVEAVDSTAVQAVDSTATELPLPEVIEVAE